MLPRVTVLMPVYNGLPFLQEAIESVLKQTLKDFELIVLIDGSTDGSREYAEACALKDSRIRVVVNEINLGTSGTMNKGIELAEAPIVARLDQDDISLPRRLASQLAYLTAHPELSIICSWEYGIDGEGRRVRNWRTEIKNYGAFLGPLVVGICPIWHPSIMFRKDTMLAAGGYKKEYQPGEDFEVTMRLGYLGYRAGVVPEYLVGQRHHGNRQSATKLVAQMNMRVHVHNEMLRTFFPDTEEDVERLGQFLRLDSAVWIGTSKEDFYRVHSSLLNLFERIRMQLHLTDQEFATMITIVYARLGRGVRYARILRRMPSAIFFPALSLFSPLIFPRIRAAAWTVHEFVQELRYPWRLLRSGLERRDQ